MLYRLIKAAKMIYYTAQKGLFLTSKCRLETVMSLNSMRSRLFRLSSGLCLRPPTQPHRFTYSSGSCSIVFLQWLDKY